MTIEIQIPGSKSITNRALLLAALSKGKTEIKNIGICDDTMYMIRGLRKLGVKIGTKEENVIVHGINNEFPKKDVAIMIFTGNAGTATRFLVAASTLTGNKVEIIGNLRMNKRPIGDLIEALNSLGAKVESKKDCTPVTIYPRKLEGGNANLKANISSQYLSALLMVSPFAKTGTTINIDGTLVSKPYIEMTIKIMKKFGLEVLNKNFVQFEIKKAKSSINKPKSLTIESDASSASYIGAFAALNPRVKILLKNIHQNSIQGDIKFLEYLEKIGCKTNAIKSGTVIQGPAKLSTLGSLDMNSTPDLVMTFAVLSIFAEGKTTLTNIGNLRVKESDRLSALKTEIRKFGIYVHTGPDFIEIHGNPKILTRKPKSAILIETYNDHRIAMAFGILKNRLPVKIRNPSCVNKSYKTFWLDLNKLIQNAN